MHSKVLSTPETRLTILPRHVHELRFDFVPRRINPAYRKQVTITNLKNEGCVTRPLRLREAEAALEAAKQVYSI